MIIINTTALKAQERDLIARTFDIEKSYKFLWELGRNYPLGKARLFLFWSTNKRACSSDSCISCVWCFYDRKWLIVGCVSEVSNILCSLCHFNSIILPLRNKGKCSIYFHLLNLIDWHYLNLNPKKIHSNTKCHHLINVLCYVCWPEDIFIAQVKLKTYFKNLLTYAKTYLISPLTALYSSAPFPVCLWRASFFPKRSSRKKLWQSQAVITATHVNATVKRDRKRAMCDSDKPWQITLRW